MKTIKLYNSNDYFTGFFQLGLDWKIQGFKEIVTNKTKMRTECFAILPAIIYFDMFKTHGCEINLKIFKNSILHLRKTGCLKFKIITDNFEGGEDIEISKELFDETINYLFEIKMIEKYKAPFMEPSPKYFVLAHEVIDYCHKLGHYLFNTKYARRSYADNHHYFSKINKTDVKISKSLH